MMYREASITVQSFILMLTMHAMSVYSVAGDVDGHPPVALMSNPFSFTNIQEEYLQSVQ